MFDYVKHMLVSQYEASLAMLNQCIAACPEDCWEDKIAQGTFRWVTYHTLFFVDLYLTANEGAFELCELHERGGDERGPEACRGLSKVETLSYVALCRQKAIESISVETEESLAGPSGFSWYPCTRGEMHLINIRHIQHHTGQLSAYLRRKVVQYRDRSTLRWVDAGWK